jgi:maltooligosyltrehalose trehalohydrolase
MIFQGEEWGAATRFQYFTDHEDPDLAEAVREGRQREFAAFGWAPGDIADPQDPETFYRSRLDWDETDREPHAAWLRWHKSLIGLRRETPDLTDGRLDRVRIRYHEKDKWMVMQRGSTTVAANLNEQAQRVPLPAGRGEILLQSDARIGLWNGSLYMPPDSVVIMGGAPLSTQEV